MNTLNESTVKHFQRLLNEKFGEPIPAVKQHIGIADDRSSTKSDLGDTEKEKVEDTNWSDFKKND
jgi:hypothetical protein